MPEIAKSVGIAIAGALIGIRVGSYAKAATLCGPPIIMALLAAVSHTHAKLEATSRRLMLVEDRVFQMTHEPLLTHETRMNMRRLGRGGKRWGWTDAIGVVVYFAVVRYLYNAFSEIFPLAEKTWIILYWTLVVSAGAYAAYGAGRITWQRRHIPKTGLLKSGYVVEQGINVVRAQTEPNESLESGRPHN